MKLVCLAALMAVCGAAKLDRTYLPPASAKSAGGSPGSLHTPFAGNSLNNGLGGLPKGSYTNEFQGVVVDAALAGTRATGTSGLGAPRITYGSTDSKVGGAAFRVKPSGFSQPQDYQPDGSQGQNQGPQGFDQSQGPNQQPSERPRAALDRQANTVKLESEVGPESYNYAFETDNGIAAEESAIATNGVQAQGAYSYTGDDGQTYAVTYTADENGYQPKGDHLPTPPPIPEEILKSLEQNAKDEAAGLVDDGSYDAKKYNTGSDYTPGDNEDGKYIHQSGSEDGSVMDASASGSFIDQNRQPLGKPGQSGLPSHQAGSARPNTLGQNAKPGRFDHPGFVKPHEQFVQGGASNGNQFGPSSHQAGNTRPNTLGHNAKPGRFDHPAQQFGQDGASRFPAPVNNGASQIPSGSKPSHSFGATSESQSQFQDQSIFQGFGNKKEYLPPVNNVNGRPQGSQNKPQSRPQSGSQESSSSESASSEESSEENGSTNNQPQGNSQENLASHGLPSRVTARPNSNISGQSSNSPRPNQNIPFGNKLRPSNGNTTPQTGPPSQPDYNFGNPNVYLPPFSQSPNQNGPGYNQQPQYNGNQAPAFHSPVTQLGQSYTPQSSFPRPTSSVAPSSSQSSYSSQQFSGFQQPQNGKPSQNSNQFSFQSSGQFGQSAQFSQSPTPSTGFTSAPDNGLTTPSDFSSSFSQTGSTLVSGYSPGQNGQYQFGNQYSNNQYSSPTSSSSLSPAFSTQSTSSPAQSSGIFGNQQYQQPASPFGNTASQPHQNPLSNNGADSQFAPSTQRPSFAQPIGSDESYFYNQPSQPFPNQDSDSPMFPAAPVDKFGKVTQRPSYPTNSYPSSPQQFPSTPTVQYSPQGPINYPNPPTLPSAAPTSSPQHQGNTVSGITQASISPFPSVPSTPETFNAQSQFQLRPGFQQSTNYFNQGSTPSKPSFDHFGSTTVAPQTFPQQPNENQNQQTLGLQSTQSESAEDSSEQPVSTQQYQGELYDYNKPAQLPPAPENAGQPGAGQFGITNQGQSDNEGSQSTVAPQFGFQKPQGRPQITAQPSSPFSPSTFSPKSTTSRYSEEQSSDDSASQFGGQPIMSEYNQHSQSSQSPQERPQYGAQPSNQAPEGSKYSEEHLTGDSVPHFGSQQSGLQYNQGQSLKPSQSKPQYGSSSQTSEGSNYPDQPSIGNFGPQSGQPNIPQYNLNSQSPQSPQSRPQYGGQPSNQASAGSAYPEQQSTHDAAPQVGGQPTGSQYNQHSQSSHSSQSKPQYGAQPSNQTPEGSMYPEESSTEDSAPELSSQPQYGQNSQNLQSSQSKPQYGAQPSSQTPEASRYPEQQSPDDSASQFGGQPTRPQYNQNSQTSQSSQSKPQYGVQPSSQTPESSRYPEESSPEDSASQFGGQPTKPQYNQNSQSSQSSQSRPQYEAQPAQPSSPFSQATGAPESQEPSTKAPFGLRPCCGSSKAGQKPAGSQDKVGPKQPFGFSSAFMQSLQPRPTMNSFAGKGEVFEASRKPPSFDENGYHY